MIELQTTAKAEELEDAAAALGEIIDSIANGDCDASPLCERLLLALLDDVEVLLAAPTAVPAAA